MASSKLSEAPETTQAFPAVDVDKELKPGMDRSVHVDPISSEVAQNLEIKEQAAEENIRKERHRKEMIETLKTSIMISGAVAAVAGAIVAITMKLREK